MTYANADLFNCCTGGNAPDWSQFDRLELSGVCDVSTGHETGTQMQSGFPAPEAQFFTVYARHHSGEHDAITDITGAVEALELAAALSRLSGLPCLVHPSLSFEG